MTIRDRPARPPVAPGRGTLPAIGFRPHPERIDHLLFLLCLVIPLRRMRTLIAVVTSFTVAHSVTLFASAYDMAPGAVVRRWWRR